MTAMADKNVLTAKERAVMMKQIQDAMDKGCLTKEDAVAILDILIRATRRKQEQLLAENPWLQESDVVQ